MGESCLMNVELVWMGLGNGSEIWGLWDLIGLSSVIVAFNWVWIFLAGLIMYEYDYDYEGSDDCNQQT